MKYRTSILILLTIAPLFAIAVSAHAQNLPLRSYRANPSEKHAARETQLMHKRGVVPPATCTYSFSTGNIFTAPANYMQYCITVSGTFENFQSPGYVEMLNQRETFEGYGICDTGSGTAVGYYDYGDDGNSGNCGTPTLLTNTTSMVKIERTTSDGVWTLTQTITAIAGPHPYAKIVMALKNNTGITRFPSFLRFAGFSPDQASANENWNENFDSTAGQRVGATTPYSDALENHSDQYGMMLQNVGSPTPITDVFGWQGFAQNTQAGPNPCNPPLTTQTVVNFIGSGYLEYGLEVPTEKTVTMTARYLSL